MKKADMIAQLTKEQTCKMFGCSMEQLSKQYAENAKGLERLLEKAKLTGRKVNGYTVDQLQSMVIRYRELAMIITDYKGFRIKTGNGSSYIYQGEELKGCTHTDYSPSGPMDNSEAKAKARIDSGRLNFLQSR